MTKRKLASKASAGAVAAPLEIRIPQDEKAAAEQQIAWARALADGILRGELPTSGLDRQFLAAIVRGWAKSLETRPKGRGNPNLKARLPGDVALIAFGRIDIHGQARGTVFADLAEMFGVDESSIGKAYRKDRQSIAAAFAPRPARRKSKE